jgi:hypothetical protein
MARRKSISDILAQSDRILSRGGRWNIQKRREAYVYCP